MNKHFIFLMVMVNIVGALTWRDCWQYFFLGGIIAVSIGLFTKKF